MAEGEYDKQSKANTKTIDHKAGSRLSLTTDKITDGNTDCSWGNTKLQFGNLTLGKSGLYNKIIVDVWDYNWPNRKHIGQLRLSGDKFLQIVETAATDPNGAEGWHKLKDTDEKDFTGQIKFTVRVEIGDKAVQQEYDELHNGLEEMKGKLLAFKEPEWDKREAESFRSFQSTEIKRKPGATPPYLTPPQEHEYEVRVYVFQAKELRIADENGQVGPLHQECAPGPTASN